MKRGLSLWALAAVLCVVPAGAETAGSMLRDEVITGHEAVPFADLERNVLALAEENGIACETASKLLYDFAARNPQRILPPPEWRYALLEGLYDLEVPYAAARAFMAALAREVVLPVDTGFLRSVRTVDLRSRVLYTFEPGRGISAPVPLAQPAPRYTDAARAAAIEGTVVIRCVVLEDGTVANCRVVRSLGYGLDESAVLTVQNEWRFQPATRGGAPIPIEANIEVRLRL